MNIESPGRIWRKIGWESKREARRDVRYRIGRVGQPRECRN